MSDAAAWPWRRSFPAVAASVGAARRGVIDALHAAEVDDALVEAVALVVSELSTNAVQAGGESFDVEVTTTPERAVRCSVTNVARPADLPPRDRWRIDAPLQERGRGLALVAAVASELEVASEGDELRITATVVQPPNDGPGA